MLDFKFIRDNADAVKANVAARFIDADVDGVVKLYEQRNLLIPEIDSLRQERNTNAKNMKGKLDDTTRKQLIEEGKRLKNEIYAKETALTEVEQSLYVAALRIPNMAHPDSPIGKEDKNNIEISRHGEPKKFDFPIKNHVELAETLDIVNFEAGAKVSGSKYYFLKNQAVLLELALIRYTLDILMRHGFTPMITPDIAREDITAGIGFTPRGDESNIYTLEGGEGCLIGTAEITLGGYLADEIINLDNGAIRLAGLSHCFRREAGAAGQLSRGLYRVHQFTKVEMFVYTKPEDSDSVLFELLNIEKEIFHGLGIPFRVVDTCTGDLGAPAYRKFDIEAWMPGRGDSGDWGEVTSTSNCTDYQARRLNIRYRDGSKTRFAHTLNGTAVAISRALIAILENYQEADGSVSIPEVLFPWCGFKKISRTHLE